MANPSRAVKITPRHQEIPPESHRQVGLSDYSRGKALETQVPGSTRRQTREEGRRVHLAVQHPTGQQRSGNEVTSRMGKAWSTLGSAQECIEQKKTDILKQVHDFSVNT